MRYTIFDTPVISTLMRWISILILKMAGWKTEGQVPDIPKFVMIAAPHTSNWDLPFTLFIALSEQPTMKSIPTKGKYLIRLP